MVQYVTPLRRRIELRKPHFALITQSTVIETERFLLHHSLRNSGEHLAECQE